MNALLSKTVELPIPERIRLVEEIWDSIVTEPGAVTLTSEQMAELDRRVEYSRLHPDDVISWETVKAEAKARK